MDFVDGLPISKSKKVISVVVDGFSKYANLILLPFPYILVSIALISWKRILSLHGTLEYIVTMKDNFCKQLLASLVQNNFELNSLIVQYRHIVSPSIL